MYLGFLDGSDSKESAYNVWDPGSIPDWEDLQVDILAWRIPWTKEPGELQRGCKESDATE